jgi:hypothetical protein
MRHDPRKLLEDVLRAIILWDAVENKVPGLKCNLQAVNRSLAPESPDGT